MAEMKIALGAVADVATSEEVSSAVSGLQGHIDRRFERLMTNDPKPIRRKLVAANAASVLMGSQSVSAVICNETPNVGRFWVLRSLCTFNAATPFTAEYTTAQAFLAVGNAAFPSTADLTGDTWQGFPHANTYNNSAIRVYPGQNVYVVVNAVVADQLAINVEIDEWLDSMNEQRI